MITVMKVTTVWHCTNVNIIASVCRSAVTKAV